MNFKQHICEVLGEEIANKLEDNIDNEPLHCLRLNNLKISNEKFSSIFSNFKKHNYVENAFYYTKENAMGKHPFHLGGAYYIQDPSAMMVVHILDPKENDKVIDLCAAPGGKSTQCLIKMKDIGLLVSNDISSSRAKTLQFNMERMGLKNSIVCNENIDKLVTNYQGYFDKVILDAPCSGEGMFRKNELVYEDWSLEKAINLVEIQKQLILKAYSLLKKDGIMVYSTCTFEKMENEDVVNYLLSNTNASLININEDYSKYRGINLNEVIRLYPFDFEGEGHFIALIKCNDFHEYKEKKQKKNQLDQKNISLIRKFFNDNIDYTLKGNFKIIGTRYFYYEHSLNTEGLHILKDGVECGEIIKDRFEPAHNLATSFKFKQRQELSDEEVKKYLHGEQINTPFNKNFVQVCYHNIDLGLGKAVNGQLKNYYPKGLRCNILI